MKTALIEQKTNDIHEQTEIVLDVLNDYDLIDSFLSDTVREMINYNGQSYYEIEKVYNLFSKIDNVKALDCELITTILENNGFNELLDLIQGVNDGDITISDPADYMDTLLDCFTAESFYTRIIEPILPNIQDEILNYLCDVGDIELTDDGQVIENYR